METFEQLIEKSEFIKNIKRMYLMKVIESYDIEKVNIIYNNTTKSFEINLIKDNRPHFFKYKVKRRRNKSVQKIYKKSKIVKSVVDVHENRIGDQDNKIIDNTVDNLEEKNGIENDVESVIYSSDKDIYHETYSNVNSDDIVNKVIQNNVQNKTTNVAKDISNDNREDNNKQRFKNTKKNIINKMHELLDLLKFSNDLLVDVFHIINNNNPKTAIKKLNKFNNNYKFVKEIPHEASAINDELIKLIDILSL
jgi:hypothetical protein